MKIYLISFLIILYTIIFLTLTVPYIMIPIDCIMIFVFSVINPLYQNNFVKDRRDICRF